MSTLGRVWLPLLLLAVFGGAMAHLLHPMPVDETRYLSVAWEMNRTGSFVLPQLNGVPYAQKPPLLFWLVNLDWRLLGVNSWSLRYIPLLLGMACVLLVYRLARVLWKDERIAGFAALLFGSTTICMAWSGLIMFDMLLTLWVLVGMLGLALAAHGARWKGWVLLAIATTAGILTKGPVILLHLLPTGALAALWAGHQRRGGWGRWFAGLLGASLLGVAFALIWALSAAREGGDAYREAILVDQSVHRAVSSFSHRAPFWYYLQWIPCLLWPWIAIPPAWRGWRGVRGESGGRMAMTWVISALVLFSCISGKRVYYLLPIVPAFSLLIARNIVHYAAEGNRNLRWARPIGVAYVALGLAGCVAAFVPAVQTAAPSGGVAAGSAGVALVLLGAAMVAVKGWTRDAVVRLVAISSAAAGLAVLPAASVFVDARYNVSEMARAVTAEQAAGGHVACFGRYHGQYGFTGRLEQPIEVLESWDALFAYANNNPDGLLVAYTSEADSFRPEEIVFQHPYRSKQALLLRNAGILRYIAQLPEQDWTEDAWQRMQNGEIECLKAYR